MVKDRFLPNGGQRNAFRYISCPNCLNPKAGSLLFAAVLLLLQPIQIEEVDPVFQIGGLRDLLIYLKDFIQATMC